MQDQAFPTACLAPYLALGPRATCVCSEGAGSPAPWLRDKDGVIEARRCWLAGTCGSCI